MLTRRKLLASTPALAVAAATAAAAEGMGVTPMPDAELIRLGAEFDRLFEAWHPIWAEMHLMGEAWQEFARKGYESGRFADIMQAWGTPEGVRYEAIIDVNGQHLEVLDKLAVRIRDIVPVSLSGLAVHARVCWYDCLPHVKTEGPRKDWDWDVECLAGFLDHIERMAGKAVQS
jgi:hypothetical protein